jgi:hypothetical protein
MEKTTMKTRILCALMLTLFAIRGVQAADPSLVGWWNCDEGPGPKVLDASGNKNDGTLTGGVQWVAHEAGGALEFDGTSGYVTIPFSESLRVTNRGGGFTLSAWFLANEVPSGSARNLFQQADLNGLGRTWLFVSNTNEIRTFLGNAATPSGLGVEAGVWCHAAVVVTEGGATDTMQMYVNGKPAGVPGQRGVEDSQGEFYIGTHKNKNGFWNGKVDDVRLYNRPLSPEEIRAMVPPKVKAAKPEPTDGDVTVVTPLLRWTAGETALLHNVYVGTDLNLGPKDLVQERSPVAMYFHVPGLTPGTTYYWRVDEIEADMTTVHTGDVWTFTARALTAYLPVPADGSNEASPDPNLTLAWQPGLNAVEHHVYFGDRQEAVRDGTASADKGIRKDPLFVPGALEPLTTYYWRVDETAVAGAVHQGAVWNFTTFLPVDDFESYTDDEGNRIYETWADGWTNKTGSQVGYIQAPFAERRIVHSGQQSLPLDYNNVNAPYYSEAEREWPTVQNWTADGADTLILYVRGNGANGLGTVYVVLEDSTNKVAVVGNPNPNLVRANTWTQWKIPLSSFAGVNIARVKRLYLGVGSRQDPMAGGAGRLYIDDIQVTRPSPASVATP